MHTSESSSGKRMGPGRRPANEARMVRKEQNRQAQVVYRERKRAAEAAQKKRVQRLEAIVEEMSSVFMTFADEITDSPVLKRNQGLIGSLTKTIETMVGLAGEAAESADSDPALDGAEAEADAEATTQTQTQKRNRTRDFEFRPVDVSDAKMFDTEREWVVAGGPTSALVAQGQRNWSQLGISPPWLSDIFGNGWQSTHGSWVDMSHPEQRFTPPDTFAYRLVEETIRMTFLSLVDNDFSQLVQDNFVFWWALQHKSREQTLNHLRFMLGPGRHSLYRAIDIPADHYATVLAVETQRRLNPNVSFSAGVTDLPVLPDKREFLSAIEVQRKVEGLVGRPLTSDTVELTLPGGRGGAGGGSPETPGDEVTKMKLSVPLLIKNLASVAVCLLVGPGYYHDGLPRAVEASLMSASTPEPGPQIYSGQPFVSW